MCGVLGWIGPCVDETAPRRVEPALLKLRSRGPDSEAVKLGQKWLLGHTRLTILDTTELAAQPMTDGEGRWLVYNGEVYNFRELRTELEHLGHRIRSTGDTEVVLCALKEWGVGALARLRGMFALCFLDELKGELFLARDRFGVKPLAYEVRRNELRFASTITALRSLPDPPVEVDAEAAYLFMAIGYVPAPHSIMRGVRKVTPGHYLRCDWTPDGVQSVVEHQYWCMREVPPAHKRCVALEDAVDDFSKRVVDSVDYRLISDVPVGSLLSGGLDSSLVTSKAGSLHPNIPCFTMGFDDASFDESPYATQVAERLGLRYYQFQTNGIDTASLVQALPTVYDEPFADTSAVPMISLSRGIAPHVKVALTGDGGDETQAGYPWHRAFARAEETANLLGPLRKGASLGKGLSARLRYQLGVIASRDRVERWSLLRTGVDRSMQRWLPVVGSSEFDPISEYYRAWSAPLSDVADPIDWACRMDLLTYLPDDLMVKADRASMSVGLELREPLLDHDLVSWQLQLPVSLRFDRSARRGKLVTRTVVGEEFGEALCNRPKQGFIPPLLGWLAGPLKELVREAAVALETGRLAPLALPPGSRSWQDVSQRLSDVHAQFSWRLLCFYLWRQSMVANQ